MGSIAVPWATESSRSPSLTDDHKQRALFGYRGSAHAFRLFCGRALVNSFGATNEEALNQLLPVDRFFLFGFVLPNGLGTALFGTDNIFFAAALNRSQASGPSIMSAVPVFMIALTLPHCRNAWRIPTAPPRGYGVSLVSDRSSDSL